MRERNVGSPMIKSEGIRKSSDGLAEQITPDVFTARRGGGDRTRTFWRRGQSRNSEEEEEAAVTLCARLMSVRVRLSVIPRRREWRGRRLSHTQSLFQRKSAVQTAEIKERRTPPPPPPAPDGRRRVELQHRRLCFLRTKNYPK